MQTLDLLRQARELIADPAHWAQKEFAKDRNGISVFAMSPSARSWCSMGAIFRTEKDDLGRKYALDHLELAIKELHPDLPASQTDVAGFNDKHTHSEVLAVFDKAILICSPPN